MARQSTWVTVMIVVSILLLVLVAMPIGSVAFKQWHEFWQLRREQLPVAQIDLATKGGTELPVDLKKQRGVLVWLLVPGEIRANEHTLGGLRATIEMVRRSDGAVFQQQVLDSNSMYWTETADASITTTGFMALKPDQYLLRLQIVEPAARLGEARIELKYEVEPLEEVLVMPAALLAGAVALVAMMILVTALLLRRRQRISYFASTHS